MPLVHLYGGECDGFCQKVPLNERPEIFYAVPLLDMARIRTIKIAEDKQKETEAARRLAYIFKKVQLGEIDIEYRYERDPGQDRVEDL